MTLLKKRMMSPFFRDSFFHGFENFPSLLERESTELYPAMNIIEDDKFYIIELAVPGFTKKEFNIDVDDGRIIISAEKESKDETKEKNYTRKEFSYSHFRRSFLIPENVDEDSIEAKFNDGLLRLKLDKIEVEDKVHAHHIEVK